MSGGRRPQRNAWMLRALLRQNSKSTPWRLIIPSCQLSRPGFSTARLRNFSYQARHTWKRGQYTRVETSVKIGGHCPSPTATRLNRKKVYMQDTSLMPHVKFTAYGDLVTRTWLKLLECTWTYVLQPPWRGRVKIRKDLRNKLHGEAPDDVELEASCACERLNQSPLVWRQFLNQSF